MNKSDIHIIIKEEIHKLLNENPLLKEAYGSTINPNEKWWAILVNSPEDWEILSKFLDNKGYKLESGYTFSGNKLSSFNPFADEKYFDSHEYDVESDDMGYSAHMSYVGEDEFVILNRPKNKLNMVNPSTFNSRKNSTYKRYNYFTNLMDLIKHINS
jgi:hypothetical protein